MADAVGLRRRALAASAFELIGFGGTQLLRFVSTLILSRLLFPEAFGLAALVTVFTHGLVMLSDVGLLECVVQNKRGDEPRFLNTVWTFKVWRGVVLWIIACLCAWPLALLYSEPELAWLLPAGAASLVIQGLSSTSMFTLRRRMASAPLVRVELASQAFGLAVVVPWAYFSPSAWAIVAGGLASVTYRCVASYFMDVGYRNRFEWDPSAKQDIAQFGKWVFGSSVLEFFARQGDRLLLGQFLGVAVLGVYSIAVMLSDAIGTAVSRISNSVLFPLLSQVRRDDPALVRALYYKMRLRLDVFGLVPVGAVMVMSQTIVDLLYDPRYREAGWMLNALCVRVAMGVVLTPLSSYLFAAGHTRFGFFQNIGRAVWVAIGIPVAWSLWGIAGVVWVAATSEVPAMLILWRAAWRLRMLDLSRELLALVILGAGIALGYVGDSVAHLLADYFGTEI